MADLRERDCEDTDDCDQCTDVTCHCECHLDESEFDDYYEDPAGAS